MSNIYDEILLRMIQYRTKLDLTQMEASVIIGKTQSQFSKIELGKTILSYEDLAKMLNAGWDIDYLLTARKKIMWTSRVTDFLNRENVSLSSDVKQVLVWAIGQVFAGEDNLDDKDISCEYALLKVLIQRGNSDSLLFELRSMAGMAQTVMAEKLGVNIKKYRDLERRITNPDAELLALIYLITACKPSLFFYQDDMEEYLLNDLWNRIELKKQQAIAAFLKHAIELRQT